MGLLSVMVVKREGVRRRRIWFKQSKQIPLVLVLTYKQLLKHTDYQNIVFNNDKNMILIWSQMPSQQTLCFHYNDVIMGTIASRLFTQPFIQAQIKENIKSPRHWPLRVEFTVDQRSPHTKGQLRGKCFHLMTSSCSKIGRLCCFKIVFSRGKLSRIL